MITRNRESGMGITEWNFMAWECDMKLANVVNNLIRIQSWK